MDWLDVDEIALTVKTAVGWHRQWFERRTVGAAWRDENGETRVNILNRGSIVVKESPDRVRYAVNGHDTEDL